MYRYLFILLSLWGTAAAGAQNTLREPAEVSRMIEAFRTKYRVNATVKAWTIQVAASSDRREIERQKSRFENLFPQYQLEWIHDDPYYIIKLDDIAFTKKVDALSLLHRIKDRYSSSAILILEDVPRHQLLTSSL